MNELWFAGDPNQFFDLANTVSLAYDDHRFAFPLFASAKSKRRTYTIYRNSDNDTPTIVGEFSLSVPDDVQWTPDWDPSTQQSFYRQWFAAQVTKYEQDTNGWVFWTWKSQLGDYRWSYQDAVAAGVIPGNVADVDQGACNGY